MIDAEKELRAELAAHREHTCVYFAEALDAVLDAWRDTRRELGRERMARERLARATESFCEMFDAQANTLSWRAGRIGEEDSNVLALLAAECRAALEAVPAEPVVPADAQEACDE